MAVGSKHRKGKHVALDYRGNVGLKGRMTGSIKIMIGVSGGGGRLRYQVHKYNGRLPLNWGLETIRMVYRTVVVCAGRWEHGCETVFRRIWNGRTRRLNLSGSTCSMKLGLNKYVPS
jgi:hypothetical protein